MVLKTLSAAIADGDHIECIIRETGVNQDGSTPGITMPSASAQETLIRSVYAKAGLDITKASDRPQYFEAHGTGTPAGDPIEAEAIRDAFFGDSSTSTNGKFPLYVGSIKTGSFRYPQFRWETILINSNSSWPYRRFGRNCSDSQNIIGNPKFHNPTKFAAQPDQRPRGTLLRQS